MEIFPYFQSFFLILEQGIGEEWLRFTDVFSAWLALIEGMTVFALDLPAILDARKHAVQEATAEQQL